MFELKIHKNTNHLGKISSDFNPEPDKGKEIKLSHIAKENTIDAVATWFHKLQIFLICFDKENRNQKRVGGDLQLGHPNLDFVKQVKL